MAEAARRRKMKGERGCEGEEKKKLLQTSPTDGRLRKKTIKAGTQNEDKGNGSHERGFL